MDVLVCLYCCLSIAVYLSIVCMSWINLFIRSIALINLRDESGILVHDCTQVFHIPFLLHEEGLDGGKRVPNLSYFVGKTGFVLFLGDDKVQCFSFTYDSCNCIVGVLDCGTDASIRAACPAMTHPIRIN